MIYSGMNRFIASVAASATVDVVNWYLLIINEATIDGHQRHHSEESVVALTTLCD